jgi:cell division protein FtsL
VIRATVAWLVLVVLAGTGLFLVKHEVQDLEERLAQLDDRIANERETVHVLRAEWAYLTRPERLARLAERHLGLKPPAPGQIANSIESLPPPTDTIPAPDDGATRPTLATIRSASE